MESREHFNRCVCLSHASFIFVNFKTNLTFPRTEHLLIVIDVRCLTLNQDQVENKFAILITLTRFKSYLYSLLLYSSRCLMWSLWCSCGLVVKAEDSWLRGPGFKPPLRSPFFRHHSFGSKLGTKIVEKLIPGIFACTAILQMGGWTLRNGRLIKYSNMVVNELQACQPTETKVQSPKKK